MGRQRTVWTKQYRDILKVLDEKGRYIVKKEYIIAKMEEHAGLYLDVYNWFFSRAAACLPAPPDVRYPVWVSLQEEEKIGNSDGNVLLELSVGEDDLMVLDLEKWGRIVNYLYIPRDAADAEAHEAMLARYGIDDTAAYMSPFYPSVKQKIIKSWDRLFDETIRLGQIEVGILWEVKREWIKAVAM